MKKNEVSDIILPDSYGSELYQPENIIGYTGDLSHPETVTVYFRKGNLFGRISQKSPESYNEGRELIGLSTDYHFKNELHKDCFGNVVDPPTVCMHEYIGDVLIHRSRTEFHSLEGLNKETIGKLKSSIESFLYIKTGWRELLSLFKKHYSDEKSDDQIATQTLIEFYETHNEQTINDEQYAYKLEQLYSKKEAIVMFNKFLTDRNTSQHYSAKAQIAYYRHILKPHKKVDLSKLADITIPNTPFEGVPVNQQQAKLRKQDKTTQINKNRP